MADILSIIPFNSVYFPSSGQMATVSHSKADELHLHLWLWLYCWLYMSDVHTLHRLCFSFAPVFQSYVAVVLIKCWVVSVWLSAKVWYGFRLAAERVSHDVPSLSSRQTPHTHARKKMFHNDPIRSLICMKVFSRFPFWVTIRTPYFIEEKILNWWLFRHGKHIKSVKKPNKSLSMHTIITIQ